MLRIRFARLPRSLPVPIVILDRMPHRLVGLSMGLFVFLRADHAHDRPTIVHELQHCRQFWRGWGPLHMLRYYLSREYRLRAELEAFRAELDACRPEQHPRRLDEAARALASGYHIGLDFRTCKALLSCPQTSASFSPPSPGTTARPRRSSSPVMARSTDTDPR